jgi:flagellar basal-body rod protein FlgB
MFGDDHARILARLMDVSMTKAKIHTANLANQNTPGYRAKDVAFDDAFAEALAEGGVDAAEQVEAKIYEPRTTPVGIDGNDVVPDKEVTASAENAVLYNTYMSILRGKSKLINTAISQSP